MTVKPATLRAFRKKERLSQAALAARATEWLREHDDTHYDNEDDKPSVSESLVALIETGRRQPSLRNAEALAAALDVPLDALADVAVRGEAA